MVNKEKALKREIIRLRKTQNAQQIDYRRMRKLRKARTEYWALKTVPGSAKKAIATPAKPEKKGKKEKEKKKEKEPELEIIEDEEEIEDLEEDLEIDEELEDLYAYDDEPEDDEEEE
ncbi:MAG: hypothetical protein EAX95_08130 [Candidatus Thorarchaeota archaeon]|nr:hypothetical protein [Candidatus Thorarchaeota archaeon]